MSLGLRGVIYLHFLSAFLNLLPSTVAIAASSHSCNSYVQRFTELISTFFVPFLQFPLFRPLIPNCFLSYGFHGSSFSMMVSYFALACAVF